MKKFSKKEKRASIRRYESLKDIHIEEILKNLTFKYNFLKDETLLQCVCYMQTGFKISRMTYFLPEDKSKNEIIKENLKNSCIRRAKENLEVIYGYIFYYNFSITFNNLYAIAPNHKLYAIFQRAHFNLNKVKNFNKEYIGHKNFFLEKLNATLVAKFSYFDTHVVLSIVDKYDFVLVKKIIKNIYFKEKSHKIVVEKTCMHKAYKMIKMVYEYIFFHKIKIKKDFFYNICNINKKLKLVKNKQKEEKIKNMKKAYFLLKKQIKEVKQIDIVNYCGYSKATVCRYWRDIIADEVDF